MNNEKTPFIVHCRECSYEWTAMHGPILLAALNKINQCPACFGGSIFIGKVPRPADYSQEE